MNLQLNEYTLPSIAQISEGMPGGFFIYHADGDENFIFFNKAVMRICGCETVEEFRELTNNSFKGFVVPEELEEVERQIWQCINEREDEMDYVQYHIKRKDGSVRRIVDYGHLVHTEIYGDVFYVFVDDMTERIVGEQAEDVHSHFTLTKKEQYRQVIVSGSIMAFCINVTDGTIDDEIYENADGKLVPVLEPAGLRLPCPINEMVDYYCRARIDSAYHHAVQDFFDRERILASYKNSEYEQFMEYTVQEGGLKKRRRITFFLSKDSTTGRLIAICNVRDITDSYNKQLHIEEMTRAAELSEAIATLNEALGSGSWSMEFDKNAQMVSCTWSDTFRRMVGAKSREDYPDVIESWSNMLHPEDKEKTLKAYWDTVNDYSGQKTYDVIYRLKTRNRGYRWFKALGRLTRRADGSPVTYYGVFMDIDDEVRAKEELIRTRKELEDALDAAQHANRSKTNFLNNMSHDIRTPMNAIIGFTSLAAMHIDDKQKVQDYLAKIQTSSNHLLSLINDVLDMSRIESGKVKIEEQEAHLPDILHDLCTIVQADIKSKQLEFFMDTVDVENEDIICDKLRVNQVLLNILSNALKFTKPGGSVSFRVTQKRETAEGYAKYEFRIKDSGIGMSRDFISHIFEPFERERTSTVSGIKGTGLGMSITKNIVDMMGGTIEVYSEVDKGTEFVVTLEFKTCAAKVKYEVIPELQGLRALVADDDADTCMSIAKMLSVIGMRPDWTTLGKEAVLRTKFAVEQKDEYSVYIIDWLIPDMNGIEVVRRIRNIIGEDKPIIILTAYDWTEIEKEAREAGVMAFCSKPLFMFELRDVLTKPYAVSAARTAESVEIKQFTGKKILLVEDNELNKEIAVEILTEAGFLVDTADDGDVAVSIMSHAKEGQYDLILMDIQMPKMDGYAATREIRSLPASEIANTPIISMTANAFEEDERRTLEAGMNGHISKPIDISKLMKTLAEILK